MPWILRRTNESIRQELNVTDSINRRKLQYFGHLKRHHTLEKTFMDGVVPGKRSRGRQRMRWEQGVKVQLGMSLVAAGRLAQDRDLYRRTVTATS